MMHQLLKKPSLNRIDARMFSSRTSIYSKSRNTNLLAMATSNSFSSSTTAPHPSGWRISTQIGLAVAVTATVYLYSQREHPTSLQDLKFLSQFGFHFLFKGDDSLSSRIDQLLYALEQNQALPSINFDSQTLSYLLQKVATNSPGSTSNSNQKQRQDEWQNLQTILSLSQKSSSDPWLYNISTSLVVMEKLEQHYRDLETNGSTKTRMALVETVAQVVAPNTSQSDGKCSTRVDPELITASCFSQLSNQLELTEDHHEPILRHFLSLWMLTKQLVVLQQHSPDQDFLQHMLHRTFLSTDFNYQIQALHEHYFTNGNMQISISELVYHTLQVYNPKERERTKWIPLIQEWLSSPDIQVNHQAVRCLVALSSEVLDPKIWSNLLLSFAKKLEINSKPPTQELESILYFLSLQQERNARLNHQQLFQAPEEEQGVEPRGKPLFQCLIPKPRPRPSSPKIYFMDLTFEGVREDLEEEEVNDMSDHEKQMELDARVLDDIQKEWLKVLFQWSVLPLEDKQHTKVIQMLSQMAVQSHLPFETSQELDREDNMEGLCWFFQRWLVEIFTHLDQTLTRTMSKEKAADQREIHQVVSHILKTITSYEKSILYSNRDHPCSDVIMAELEKALTAVALLFGTNDGQIQKDMNDHHPHLMKSLIECLVLCLHCFSPETEPPLSNNGDVAIEANEWAAEKKKYLRIFNQAIRVLANISAMSCQQFQKCHDRSNMFDIQRMMMSSEYGQRAFNSLCRTSSSTSHHRNCDTIELESNVLRLVLNMKTLHSLVDLSPEEETKAASYYCEGTNVIYPSADLLQALDHDKDSSQLDVVFLHGLRGHAFGTWRVSPDSLLTTLEGEKEERDFCCWPQAWLGPDLCQNLGPPENKNMCRILTLGYDASLLSSSSDPWRPLTFEEYAASIAKQLSAAKVGQDRPVVFITHSLGGLMLKEILLHHEQDMTDIRGIVFVAVPHLGANVNLKTSVVNFDEDLLRRLLPLHPATKHLLTTASAKEDQPREEKFGSTTLVRDELAQLDVAFQHYIKQRGIPVCHLAESLPLDLGAGLLKALIVTPASACPAGYGVSQVIPNADHVTICKPPNRHDPRYVVIQEFIRSTFS